MIFVAGLGVEVAGRLVGQDDGGIGHQRPRDGHPLPLSARELVRPVLHAVRQPDRLEGLLGAPPPLRLRHPGVDQGQLDVVEDVGAREEVEGLEDEPDPAVADLGQLGLGHLGHHLPFER